MPWWQGAVFYEVYLRSFQDSNDDGIGDLRGLTSRLDLLQDLGFGAIWITPFYPSPQVDFGYDVSDYENVDPVYGTLADFDALVADAHRRDIRVVIDLVLNHTSDRHAWFESSRRSRSSPLRDWYVWRDGRGDGPPTNWESAFGGPAWTRDAATGQWYYHAFYPEQPDLNWRNPAVEERMFAAVKFWLDHGVDGFRLDAVNTLFEDEALRDNPRLPAPRIKITGVDTQEFRHTRGLPEVHGVLRRLRRFVDRQAPEAVLISEAYVEDPSDLSRFYGEDDEMHLPFNFFLAQVRGRDPLAFRRMYEAVEAACAGRWPSLVLSNHDIDRACDRYAADGADPDAVARLLATMLLTLKGTPFVYYGEPIAMRTEPPARIEDVRDPVGRRFWPDYKGRDGVRRPLPWRGTGPGAGFTRGTPWLPLPADAAVRNVARQLDDPHSVLNHYRALIDARRGSRALLDGEYRAVNSAPDVFAYVRQYEGEAVLVVLNMANASRDAQLSDVDRSAFARVRVGTHRASGSRAQPGTLRLHPLEAIALG